MKKATAIKCTGNSGVLLPYIYAKKNKIHALKKAIKLARTLDDLFYRCVW